jgi:hypothetical protein
MGPHGRNIFNELLDRMGILELATTAVWAATELDLKVLIDIIGFAPAGARMSTLAPRPLGRHGAFLWLDSERSSLAVRGALSGCEGLFQLGDALCFDLQLLIQRSDLGPQGLQFGRHLGQPLSLQERGLE